MRQTGRTTQMLQDGLNLAGKMPKVLFIFHNMHMAKYAYDMFMKLLPDIPPSRTKFKIFWKDTEFCFTSANMQYTSQIIEGQHNTMVYCDHVVRGIL